MDFDSLFSRWLLEYCDCILVKLLGRSCIIFISAHEYNLIGTWLVPCVDVFMDIVLKILHNYSLVICHLVQRTR